MSKAAMCLSNTVGRKVTMIDCRVWRPILSADKYRPGGNLTGATSLLDEIGPKRLGLMHELVPTATTFAVLINPTFPSAKSQSRDLEAAAHTLGLQLHVVHAVTERDLDKVFATLVQLRAGGLVICPDPFFSTRIGQLAELTVRHAVPAIYQSREFVTAGGLMSYGAGVADTYRQAGIYVGRILKGEKPGGPTGPAGHEGRVGHQREDC